MLLTRRASPSSALAATIAVVESGDVSSSIRHVVTKLMSAKHYTLDNCTLVDAVDVVKADLIDFYHNNYQSLRLSRFLHHHHHRHHHHHYSIDSDNVSDDDDDDDDMSWTTSSNDKTLAVTMFRKTLALLSEANGTDDAGVRQGSVLQALAHSRQLRYYHDTEQVQHHHFPIEQILALVLPFWIPLIVPIVRGLKTITVT